MNSEFTIDNGVRGAFLENFNPFPNEEPHHVLYASYSRRGYFDAQISGDKTNQIRQDLNNLGARLQKLSNNGHPGHERFKEACVSILGFVPGVIPDRRDRSNSLSIGIYTDNMDTIDANGMGQGVLQVTGLLTILFTQENKIILLEEIENDLHPKVLKQLLDIIVEKSNENQFIISTHSNIVLKHLGAIPDSKIFKTSWEMRDSDGHKLPVSNIIEIKNDAESRMSVLREMGYDIMDFELWYGYLLFEESTAELIVREYLIPFFTPNLKNKIRTVASKGVDDVAPRFKSFLSLFVFIHLSGIYRDKAWVLVDGDASGQKVIRDLRSSYSSWKPEHFKYLSQHDFELYYPTRFGKDVSGVLQMTKGAKKQAAKVELRDKVLKWSLENPSESKEEWKISALEVIEFLRVIAKSLP